MDCCFGFQFMRTNLLSLKSEGHFSITLVVRIRFFQIDYLVNDFDWRFIWIFPWRDWYVGPIISSIPIWEFKLTCLLVQGNGIIQRWIILMWHLDTINCRWLILYNYLIIYVRSGNHFDIIEDGHYCSILTWFSRFARFINKNNSQKSRKHSLTRNININ